MGKVIGGAIALVAIILAVIVGVFYFNLDKIIIAAVEKYGSEVTKSDVKLAEVDLDPTSGSGGLRGLTVGNPSGFKEPSAFDLGGISLKVNVAGSSEELIHIEEIIVSSPQITYEVNENGNNLDVLKKNIDDFIKAQGGESKDSSSSSSDGEEGPKLIIDRLSITGGKVTVSAPITMNQKIEGNLPDINLKDIGKDSGGADPAEVAAQIADSITEGALGVVSGLGIGKTLDSLKEGLSGVTGAVEGVTKNLPTSGGGATKAVEDAAGGIKKLFD
ncbi:hypothetical protein GUA87_01550 [Sneathiella sp. P13V-1]|uniref:hypothetical protein n=1 Tax=Sneathiella sp. P13V-1 TaxID=2697366 RepID=UPI00187B362E|nr:hypothetical protein [Sneathiella sp. P13V-1]MBE7635513.1 hypothetical protein [Sneathiella sp. P13V-1]